MAGKKKFKFKAKSGEEFLFSEAKGKLFKKANKKQLKELKGQDPVMEVFSWNPT